ncbi:hypothetical protein VTL71DRAFT_860 [Oculimacula yallundae]|uniref:Uncharacterized protein n=1 Tax=Oculimacula yallundae TaxID=86028 RepID=A0ABR4D262_9HELO
MEPQTAITMATTTHPQYPTSKPISPLPLLTTHLRDVKTLICILTGSDLHLSAPLIDASLSSSVDLFVPSEYGLDTSNEKIRDLLPPYRTRFEIQEKLRASGMRWKAIYAGIGLEEGMKTDGVLALMRFGGVWLFFLGRRR